MFKDEEDNGLYLVVMLFLVLTFFDPLFTLPAAGILAYILWDEHNQKKT